MQTVRHEPGAGGGGVTVTAMGTDHRGEKDLEDPEEASWFISPSVVSTWLHPSVNTNHVTENAE